MVDAQGRMEPGGAEGAGTCSAQDSVPVVVQVIAAVLFRSAEEAGMIEEPGPIELCCGGLHVTGVA